MGRTVVEVIYKLKALIRVETKLWKVECLIACQIDSVVGLFLCKIMKPFSLIVYFCNIFLYLTGGIYIRAASLINYCTYSLLFS